MSGSEEMNVVPLGTRQGCGIPLKLELLAVVSFPIWVLGTEFRSSAKPACTLKHRNISLAPTKQHY